MNPFGRLRKDRVIESLFAPYLIFNQIRLQLLSFAVLVGLSALIYHHFQHLNLVGSIYAGVSTITTIGLYAPFPLPDQEMVLLIVLIVLSVGLVASTVQVMMTTIVRREIWVAAENRWRARHLKKHTVVCGDNDILLSVCRKLKSMHKNYVVVTSSEFTKKRLEDSATIIFEDPKMHESLVDAGIKEASAVVIAFEEDATSLIVTLNAEQLNPKATKIVAIKSLELQDHFKQAGADVVIPVNSVAGRIMAASTVAPNVGGVIFSDDLRGGVDLELGIFEIEKGSQADGSPVGLIDEHAITLAIIRNEKIVTYFDQKEALKHGDKIMVLGNYQQFEKLAALVGEAPEAVKSLD